MTRNKDEAQAFWVRFDREILFRRIQLKDIAQACDIPYGSLTGWRNKHLFPDIEAMTSIVKYVGCSLDTLLGIKERTDDTAVDVYQYLQKEHPGLLDDIMEKLKKEAGFSGTMAG